MDGQRDARVQRRRGKAPPTNLPVLRDRLVGRECELTNARQLLLREDVGLLTLTGAGGSGKTRVALDLARSVLDEFADGVFFVPLAPISDPGLVGSAIAQVLGVREVGGRPVFESVKEHLRDKALLLVLDNFEQLLPAAPLVGKLLASCPSLTVLVTSRTRLRLSGEQEVPVQPLATPGADETGSLQRIRENPSVALFLRRAQAVKPSVALTEENAATIAEIVRRLDGLPLAIELAAARSKILSPAALLARLSNRLSLLAGGTSDAPARLRSMRAAIAWSYDLLDPPSQTLFRHLAVFVGDWTLEATEVVCGAGGASSSPEHAVLESLATLVDHSLVREVEERGVETRFGMLETIREYALELLRAHGEADELRARHATYFRDLAERAAPELSGPSQVTWMRRLQAEHDNLRAALTWAFESGDIDLAARLSNALAWFWYTGGLLAEGLRSLKRVRDSGRAIPADLHAKTVANAGFISMFRGDYASAKAMLEEAISSYRGLGDTEGVASSITLLAMAGLIGQRPDIPVDSLIREAVDLRLQLKDARTIGNIFNASGIHALTRGDAQQSLDQFAGALDVYRGAGDLSAVIWATTNIGFVAIGQADYCRAAAMLSEALFLAAERGDKNALMQTLYGLACAAAGTGQAERAAQLWGAEEALRSATGLRLSEMTHAVTNYEHHLSSARARLGETAFAEAWAVGRALPEREAVACGLADEAAPSDAAAGAPPGTTAAPSRLTPRETEILRLIVAGKSNREISVDLVLSVRTVERHIENLYRKLGVHSRSEATATALRQHLA